MTSKELDAIRQNALSLPLGERSGLARDLIASLDEPPDADAKAEWDQEICRRINSLRSGEATLLEPEEVLTRIRERLTTEGCRRHYRRRLEAVGIRFARESSHFLKYP